MKVFVQVPCLNEAETLPLVLKSIPKEIPGVDLEVLVIDDGSTDTTVAVARKYGVKHFVRHRRNRGLARSFSDGVTYALMHGADIVVNTDGDNQYPQERIPDLLQPILDGKADIVIADRQTRKIAHFSPLKKFLQRLGSFVVNQAAGTDLPDASSGFRAYSRESLLRLNVITDFSYCMETIIQSGNKKLAITNISITTNPKTRESRLFKNMWQHVFKSMSAIVRSFIMYKPYAFFLTLGVIFLAFGLVPFIKFAIEYLTQQTQVVFGPHHLQSLIIGSVLLIASFIALTLGVIADLTRVNRLLLEDTLKDIKHNVLANPEPIETNPKKP